ncbi:MAG: ATP-binding protein [Defluviitaleaceae bacterium]|nr:ATP-binding protein [Defluviitaleaceae bacterium]MCL2240636.1 ATP-binding protein [Defluviitaleaceae bacterium]
MLKRKIYDDLVQWKARAGKQCLLVKGARQVGKTFIIALFARENYRHVALLNFVQNPGYRAIFDGDLDADTLVKQISLRVPGASLVPGETLIFLDEIQDCPRARAALKFLAQDKRFDVIASGSMLGINYKDVPSYPVGYVDHLEMHSLDFEEFLWASGVTPGSVADVKAYYETKKPVPTAMHERMMQLFKEYIVVGGMPRVVNEFVSTCNFANVLKMQRSIISDYTDDIAKYADGAEKAKVRACFLSIPKHLSKDYKKFQYSIVERGGSARKFGGSLMWLYDAGIINFCHNLAIPALPLEGNAKSDAFKVYMCDTGLLMAMLEDGSQEDIIDGHLGIYKGAIYENIIADIFTKAGRRLYYFEQDGRLEIDFFIRKNKTATAIEVKSADNTKSKSMEAVLDKYGVRQGIKLSMKNVGAKERITSLPLYMAMFL